MKIAYFDLDNSLADYEQAVLDGLESLRSPNEEITTSIIGRLPDHIFRRKCLITSSVDFWVNLKPIDLGFQVIEICKKIGYKIVVLTCTPKLNPNAATGKLIWSQKHLGKDIDFKLVSQKNIDFGHVLYDDFPEYMDGWLKTNPNGLGLVPSCSHNVNYNNNQTVKVNFENLDHVYNLLKEKYYE